MITTDWLKEQGFKFEQYPDGMFWLLRKREELFLQADEAHADIYWEIKDVSDSLNKRIKEIN